MKLSLLFLGPTTETVTPEMIAAAYGLRIPSFRRPGRMRRCFTPRGCYSRGARPAGSIRQNEHGRLCQAQPAKSLNSCPGWLITRAAGPSGKAPGSVEETIRGKPDSGDGLSLVMKDLHTVQLPKPAISARSMIFVEPMRVWVTLFCNLSDCQIG